LRELGELVGGHCEIGAWGLVYVMVVNADKLVIEVALEWPSLRVKLLLYHHDSNLICAALCMVDVLVLAGGAFLLSFAILRGLSMLTLKIAPSWNGGGRSSSVVISATVSVEP
jgi:hypothetical protein